MKLRTICLRILLFSIINCGLITEIKSQEKESIQKLIEEKITSLNENKNLFSCFNIIKEQGLNELFNDIPIGFPLDSTEETFYITSLYGIRNHPIEKKNKVHKGIDIAAQIGTYISSTGDGIVESVQYSDSGYGKKITIKHKYGFYSVYAHLAYIAVKKGDKIKKGKVIGLMGSTGASTGTHLHYEIHKNNSKLDPKKYIVYSI